jgi:hypothetical protein
MDATQERAALAAAIDEFQAAETVYTAACEAAEAAGAAVHAALRGDGAELFDLAEAQSRASLVRGAALEVLARANRRVITAANIVIEAGSSQEMRVEIEDLAATDPIVLAWRNCRNALIRDASAPLVGAAG